MKSTNQQLMNKILYELWKMLKTHIYLQQFFLSNLIMIKQKKPIYLQKQSSLSAQCGVCALNNLLGTQMFLSSDLDNICKQLSQNMINPYKSVFGGDFDVTVLIKALESKQWPVRWLKNSQKIYEVLSNDFLKGVLINTQQKDKSFFKKFIDRSGRHWTCIKKQNHQFILLDSMKQQPIRFNKQYCVSFLESIKKDGGTILIIQLEPSVQNIQKKQNN